MIFNLALEQALKSLTDNSLQNEGMGWNVLFSGTAIVRFLTKTESTRHFPFFKAVASIQYRGFACKWR